MSVVKKEKHEHKWKPTTTRVMAHQKSTKGFIDTLKQWKCDCGAKTTYDLERKPL